MMWMIRKATAPNDAARCADWMNTRCPGFMNIRSVATSPSPTDAHRAISAKTPA